MIRVEYLDEAVKRGIITEEQAAGARKSPRHYAYHRGRLVRPARIACETKEQSDKMVAFYDSWEILPFVPEGEYASLQIRKVGPDFIEESCTYGQLTYMKSSKNMVFIDMLLAYVAELNQNANTRVLVAGFPNRKTLQVEALRNYVNSEADELSLMQGISLNSSGRFVSLDRKLTSADFGFLNAVYDARDAVDRGDLRENESVDSLVDYICTTYPQYMETENDPS